MILQNAIVLAALASAWGDKPHIIFILADDLGWNDVGFHGSSQISTPNIDALAYKGLILNNHYVQPVCTPSRAALMTGKYPIHLGFQRFVLVPGEPRALPSGKILPNYLKEFGYNTYLSGKWHLGHSRLNETPTYRGFDSHLGCYIGSSYYDHITAGNSWHNGEKILRHGYDMVRNTTTAWDLEGQYSTDIFTEEAVRVINQHDKSKPLFLMLSHIAPHAGTSGVLLEAPRKSVLKHHHIIDVNRRTYAGMVSTLDDSVGKVVQTLKLNNMLQKSIIIFIADNGAPTIGADIYNNWGSNYPLRGIKSTLWEGGVRGVAAIWSPLLKRRGVTNSLFHITDWLPTLLSAAGGNLTNLKIDGVNQWPLLIGKRDSVRNKLLYNIFEKKNHSAFRQDNWKLIIGQSPENDYTDYYGENGNNNKWKIQYNIKDVRTCDAGRAISSIGPFLTDEDIMNIREKATVNCSNNNLTLSTPCNITSSESICLFNLATDPCETNDVSKLHRNVVETIKIYIKVFYQTLVPETNVPPSPCGIPELHNYTWTSFLDNGSCR